VRRSLHFFAAAVATLLAVPALAAFGNQTVINLNFPRYVVVYTNVTSVSFFSSTTAAATGALAGQTIGGTTYYTTVDQCLNALNQAGGLPSAYSVNATTTQTASATCDFAPNDVVKDSGFSVSGYANAATNDTDGELLIISNDPAATFAVSATPSGTLSAPVYVVPGYVNTSGQISQNSTTTPQDVTTGATFTQADAYTTDYSFARVIPLLFYAQIDPLSTGQLNESVTLTWSVVFGP